MTDVLPLYITRDRKTVVMSDGSSVPVTDYLDREGDDTTDVTQAFMVIAGPLNAADDEGYMALEIDDHPTPTFH
jgi:hypothetical protein